MNIKQIVAAVMLLGTLTVNAQNVVCNNYEDTDIKPLTDTETAVDMNEYKQWGITLEYLAVKKGWGLNMRSKFYNFEWDLSAQFGNTNDIVTDNSSLHIDLGYAPRYWFSTYFFIEGYVGVGYASGSITTKTPVIKTSSKGYTYSSSETTETKNHNFYLSLTPRIGVRISKSWAIQAGYRFDFAKFKFDKEYRADYFTIGVTWLL